MPRDELSDLMSFLIVAKERSFTRAAARLGTSQSALSHVVRRLEQKHGVRLLTRTTRSVSPTEAGQRLTAALEPAFADIEAGLDQLNQYRSQPSGTVRITTSSWPAMNILMPAANRIMAENPDICFDVETDPRLTDIASDGFDAGIRLGERVEKDMIAVRIGPDIRLAVAGSPDYFKKHAPPETPHDLTAHNCLNLRLPTWGGLYVWEFERDGHELNVRVEGQFISNDPDIVINAALNGQGLLCLPDDYVRPYVASGNLVTCLDDWCQPFPGYHLYYPSRNQNAPAFRLLVDALKYRGKT
ncbi:LysR family transcriptional regulator [Martelella mediterranea]|uniref:LysR family transcriptional regulator n=1 Tax=Martelella mediterranea TaxID=293089 RepID=UPI0010460FFB|nr:LysR family transcriptional regulator [Martelella mediterranea]